MTDYTPERAVKIIDRIIEIQAEKAELEEAEKNLKAKLASFYDDGEHVEEGRKVTVYHHKAINAAYAKKNHPDLYKKGSETQEVFNATTAKKNLTEEEYALCQKVSQDQSVKIELVED